MCLRLGLIGFGTVGQAVARRVVGDHADRLRLTRVCRDSSDVSNIARAIDANTRLVYVESIGNPKNNVDDFAAIAEVAHAHGLPLVVDNTVSPVIFRRLEHGADVVRLDLAHVPFLGEEPARR